MPYQLAHRPERTPLADDTAADVLGLHAALDGVGRVEEEVVADAGRRAARHLLVDGQRRVAGLARALLAPPPKHQAHPFVPTEPRGRPARLADERAELPVPEPDDALVPVHRGHDAERPHAHDVAAARLHGDLHLAFDQLNGCEERRREGAGRRAADQQGAEWQRLGGGEDRGLKGFLAEAVLAWKISSDSEREVMQHLR